MAWIARTVRTLSVAETVYVELLEKRLCCRMATGESVQSVSLRESFQTAAAGFLAHPAFALCGVSYAVNLDHVIRVGQGQLHLHGERTVPLSRAYREKFVGRWMDYHLGGEA